jgi:hypothetical protein
MVAVMPRGLKGEKRPEDVIGAAVEDKRLSKPIERKPGVWTFRFWPIKPLRNGTTPMKPSFGKACEEAVEIWP